MNKQLIEKVIKSNDASCCPEFTYENPLLDRNVAKALASSFVKILRFSQQNSNINNNLRYAVLANIRKTCRLQPENHVDIGDIGMNLLTEVYIEELENPHRYSCTNSIEKDLDDFLMRKLKELDLNSNYQSSINPEVAISLVNLNEKSIDTVSQNVLNLDKGKKSSTLLKELWSKPECVNNVCDVSITMKPEIEKILLNLCHDLLSECMNLQDVFCLDNLKDILHKCSISPDCFQICYEILHSLFSTVNYCLIIHQFIIEFVRKVKVICQNTISVLYPVHLCHIVVALDIDISVMPEEIQESYIKNTLPYLNKLFSHSKSDFVLLLSHYPDWFDIYFEK